MLKYYLNPYKLGVRNRPFTVFNKQYKAYKLILQNKCQYYTISLSQLLAHHKWTLSIATFSWLYNS